MSAFVRAYFGLIYIHQKGKLLGVKELAKTNEDGTLTIELNEEESVIFTRVPVKKH